MPNKFVIVTVRGTCLRGSVG